MITYDIPSTTSSEVVAGVDTHTDTHTVAICDLRGQPLATETFPTNAAGYQAIVDLIADYGTCTTVGVEGTNSYGAGLTRVLQSAGIDVKEVLRPARQIRHKPRLYPTH